MSVISSVKSFSGYYILLIHTTYPDVTFLICLCSV